MERGADLHMAQLCVCVCVCVRACVRVSYIFRKPHLAWYTINIFSC